MKVKLGKSFKSNRLREGQIVDLPEGIAKAGIEKGLYEALKSAPAKSKAKKKA